MKISGNTILITGGGSGIGLGLAKALQAEGNQVIIAGRRKEALASAVAANPGMKSIALDIADPASIRGVAKQLASDFPALNAVILNAGISKLEKLLQHNEKLADAEAMITTNLLGPIRLTAALLPQLTKQPQATIMTVSSGLAFVPLPAAPTYCATKAGLHSYTMSLREQLKKTKIQVIELIPPYVQTELGGQQQATDPRAMPLDAFIAEVMQILKTQPAATEINVERVKPMRFAAENGKVDEVFAQLSQMMPHD